MIEAIACGIPVSGFRCGSVPEVVEDGVGGFIVDSVDEAARAVERVSKLSRGSCREAFLRRFRASRMAEDYVAVYERLRPEGAAPEEATAA